MELAIQEVGRFRKRSRESNRQAPRLAAGCAIEQISAEGINYGVDGSVEQDIRGLRETIDDIRDACADIKPPAIPFDAKYRFSANGKPDVPATGWAELERLFAAAAGACAGLAWCDAHWQDVDNEKCRLLLNSIGAHCQLLRKALDAHNARDGAQLEMYNWIKDLARDSGCFLTSLVPETVTEDLVIHSSLYETYLAEAKCNWKANNTAREKARVKESARAYFERLMAEQSGSEIQDEYRSKLLGALDGLNAAGIPYSDKKVREALLFTGPSLLSGEPRFEKLLTSIAEERSRRGLDTSPCSDGEVGTEEDIASVLPRELDCVREWATGLKLLIMGGVPRQKTRDELMGQLGFTEVVWGESKPSDKAQKFRSAINKADVVMVLKNFAGHDMSEKGREWARANGAHFLMLPSGYGVNQIIQQLYEYIQRGERG